MGCSDGANSTPNQFALVSYIPGTLGEFLDDLRLELVPGCSPNAHVTILPPRPIQASEDVAAEEILHRAEDFSDFEVELGEVEVFPVSKVVFINLKKGEKEIREIYRLLNSGAVEFKEPYPFHPHVTLAQKFPIEEVDSIFSLAHRRWEEYRDERRFPVNCLEFVKNLYGNNWMDLASVRLRRMHPVAI